MHEFTIFFYIIRPVAAMRMVETLFMKFDSDSLTYPVNFVIGRPFVIWSRINSVLPLRTYLGPFGA